MKHFTLLGLALMLCGGIAVAQPRSASAPQKLLSSPTGYMAPVWSPDGSMIAVTGDNYTGIMVAKADGSAIRTVSTEPGAGYKMMWDGTDRIIGRTNVNRGALVYHEMRAWNVTDGASEVLVPLSRNAQAPTRRAAGLRKDSANIYELMMSQPAEVASQVGALNQFAGKILINPALSPDGNRIAFQVPGQGMWVINIDGSGLRQIGAGSHPAWLNDNATIVYTIVKDNGQEFTSSTLFALNIDNGTSITLTRSDIMPLTPAVSPDGTKVAFENASDKAIYVITLNY